MAALQPSKMSVSGWRAPLRQMIRAKLLIVCLLSAMAQAQTPTDVAEAGAVDNSEQPPETSAAAEVFVPEEDIEDDLSVSYPVDI